MIKQHLVLGIVGILALGLIICIVTYFGYSNSEIRLRNQIASQQDSNRVVYDNTWKIIKEQANVADQYKDAFKEIYPALMEGRYGNARGGALLSFVKEANPHFDIKLYEKLANSIEGQRTNFTNEQRKLRDLKNSHDSMLDTFPGSFFLSSRTHIDVTLVTSDKTETAFSEGKDNELLVK